MQTDHFYFKWSTQFVCMKIVSSRFVRHALAYLTVRKWWVGDAFLYRKFWPKL